MTQGNDNRLFVGKGFSLLETVLVLFILGTVAALAMPRYVDSLNFYRADLAAKRVAADLAMARNNAWAAGVRRTVLFTPATDQYRLPGIPGLDRASAQYVVTLSATPYHCDIVSANFQGYTSTTFDGYGLPNRGGQVVVRAGAFLRTIVLDPSTGSVTVQ